MRKELRAQALGQAKATHLRSYRFSSTRLAVNTTLKKPPNEHFCILGCSWY